MVHGGIRAMFEGLGAVEKKQRQTREAITRWTTKTDHLHANMAMAWNKSGKAMRCVEQVLNLGNTPNVLALKSELATITSWLRVFKESLKKASQFVVELSAYVSSLPTAPWGSSTGAVPLEDFRIFKVEQEQTIASMSQELKRGAIKVGGIVVNGKDVCIAFAWEQLPRELVYHCIPSLLYAMCMPLDEVVLQV